MYLSSSEIVQEVIVLIQVQEPGKQALRARAHLKSGFILHINESLGRGYRNYSYHIEKRNTMVRRCDNAPHWPAMKTFPHHLHWAMKIQTIECEEMFIDDVLIEMKAIIEGEGIYKEDNTKRLMEDAIEKAKSVDFGKLERRLREKATSLPERCTRYFLDSPVELFARLLILL